MINVMFSKLICESDILRPCPFVEDLLTVHLTFLPKLKADLRLLWKVGTTTH